MHNQNQNLSIRPGEVPQRYNNTAFDLDKAIGKASIDMAMPLSQKTSHVNIELKTGILPKTGI